VTSGSSAVRSREERLVQSQQLEPKAELRVHASVGTNPTGVQEKGLDPLGPGGGEMRRDRGAERMPDDVIRREPRVRRRRGSLVGEVTDGQRAAVG
jgi:hypothetical protein